MNVHDIHAKQDAAMLAGLRSAGETIEPPGSLDPTIMAVRAVRAVRNVRRRRVVVTATACAAALALTGAGFGGAAAIFTDHQEPLPGTDRTSTEPTSATESPSEAPSPSASTADEPQAVPTELLETGGGTLPVLPGVERGVVENGGRSPYILGGLRYEVPSGGWIAVGDVNAGGVAGWLDPDHPEAGGLGETGTIDDMDATIELRNVTDVAGWTAPAQDSGATTLDIEGADLVVIEQHEREGRVRPATVRIRSGAEGWVIETRFAANERGDGLLRNFVGNLWLADVGAPGWYQPEFSIPVLDAIERGVPADWVRTEHNGLDFAVPKGWSDEKTEGEFSPGVEWTGPTVTHVDPGADPETLELWQGASPEGIAGPEGMAGAAEETEWPERVYVQGGRPGGNWWSQDMNAPQSQMIDVPGADYAEVLPTAYYADGEVDYYWVDIYLHQEDQGENLFLVVEFDGTDRGLKDLHTFLGTLDFRR